jgi:hypothetical protein
MQPAVNKAIRIGRPTMLAISVGVVLALVVGVATVALAAVPGDPFKLAQVNIINNATTALQGNGPSGIGLAALLEVKRDGVNGGPALRVQNTSTGIGASGIRVDVAKNKAPISVNSEAGKANFLNVDKVDGRDASDFLSATRLYGGSAFVTNTSGADTVLLTALDGLRCDEGDVAINGGANAIDINDTLNNITPFAGSYQIEFKDNPPKGSNFSANIICSDTSSPFRNQ